MRRVACYAATSALKAEEGRDEALDALELTTRAWLASKGQITGEHDGQYLLFPDGRRATLAIESRLTSGGRVSEYQLTEPTDSGRFLTRLIFGGEKNELGVFIELRAGGEELRVKPIPVDARCPDIYRNFLDLRDWATGETRVRTKPLPFLGRQGADSMIKFINCVFRRR
jgi:hypothetical protein